MSTLLLVIFHNIKLLSINKEWMVHGSGEDIIEWNRTDDVLISYTLIYKQTIHN